MLLDVLVTILVLGSVLFCVEPEDVKILEYVNERFGNGEYHFRYVTSDGQEREETGKMVKTKDTDILSIVGHYSYVDDTGNSRKTTYEADEQGSRFRNQFSRSHLTKTSKLDVHQKYSTPNSLATTPPLPPQNNSLDTDDDGDLYVGTGVIATLAGGGIG